MRLKKVAIIAEFELVAAVRRPAYLFMTFGLPVFFGLVSGVPAYLQQSQIAEESERVAVLAVVDGSGLLHLADRGRALSSLEAPPASLATFPADTPVVAHGTVVLLPVEGRESARDAMRRGFTDGALIVPEDYLEGGAIQSIVTWRRSPLDVTAATTQAHLRRLLLDGLLHERLPTEYAERVRDPLAGLEEYTIGESGRVQHLEDPAMDAFARFLVPVVLSMLLLMALMTTGGYLVQGIGSEKENRVIEVLLATVRPDEILAGKLLGLGAAGLMQFGVWAGGFVATLVTLLGMLEGVDVRVPWGAVAVAPLLFVMGYLFYGSLMLSTGSLGQTASESQKLTLMWGMLALLPMLFLPAFLDAPHGLIALVMHWTPFTAPLAIVLRMAQDPEGVSAWEIAGSIGVLGVCTWLSLRIGARVFRVGVLLGGGWPGWRQILRQAEITD